MKTKRRTAIRIETHELTIIRFRQNEPVFCNSCRMKTAHLSIGQAVSGFSLEEPEIYRLIGEEKLHSLVDEATGELFLCGNSLAAQRQKN
jgi:hypothetical protein